MNRVNKIEWLFKIAVNKENQKLRDDFIEKFSEENRGKAAAIADQWYSSFRGTEIFNTWTFLGNLNEVIKFIKENKDAVESVTIKHENKNLTMLSELYPEKADVFKGFDDRFLSWIASRFGSNPSVKEIHPLNDSIPTLLSYSENLDRISDRFNSNEEYRRLFKERVGPTAVPNKIKELSIDQMESAINLSKRSPEVFIDIKKDYSPSRFLGQFGQWKLWIPETIKDSIAIAGFDEHTMEPDTTWCTARTTGRNLFTSYADENIILFYVIKDGAQAHNDNDYQSIGWRKNPSTNFDVPETLDYGFLYNGDGTETVNRGNDGVYKSNHRALFGAEFDNIYDAMKAEIKANYGIHPIKKIFETAGMGDKKAIESLLAGAKGSYRDEILHEINVSRYSAIRERPRAAAKSIAESGNPDLVDTYVESGFHMREEFKEYTRMVAKTVAGTCDSENIYECDYFFYRFHEKDFLQDISLPLLTRLAERGWWYQISNYFSGSNYADQNYEERKAHIPLAIKFVKAELESDDPDDIYELFQLGFYRLDETKDLIDDYVLDFIREGRPFEPWLEEYLDKSPVIMENIDSWAKNFLSNIESGKFPNIEEWGAGYLNNSTKFAEGIIAKKEEEKEEYRDILDQMIDYSEDLGELGITLEGVDRESAKEMLNKILSIAKELASNGSIIFYDLDFTDIEITESLSASWAKNFVSKMSQKSELSRGERVAKMLAEEIMSEENELTDKLAQLSIWLNGAGLKKEANNILMLKRFRYE